MSIESMTKSADTVRRHTTRPTFRTSTVCGLVHGSKMP